jgi:hypothetical protein
MEEAMEMGRTIPAAFEYKYFMSWWNGGGAHIVSQDRLDSSNGITVDWIIGDEA